MIRFEHSLFALPFALAGALLAWRDDDFRGGLFDGRLLWIVVAMVAARSAAMAFNRLLDHESDGRNPRTAQRHLPAGLITRKFATLFTVAASALFVFAAAMLNPLCLALSPVALAIVLGYSYTKRFTSLSHIVLGLALGIAPAAAWMAVRGELDPRVLWLTAAVMLWTAGFDIIYSCQDTEFDRRTGLQSIPARWGVATALNISRSLHAGMLAALAVVVVQFGLGWVAWMGVALVGALLIYEHSLVDARDLSRVNAAFFTVNGYISVLFLVCWAVDVWAARQG